MWVICVCRRQYSLIYYCFLENVYVLLENRNYFRCITSAINPFQCISIGISHFTKEYTHGHMPVSYACNLPIFKGVHEVYEYYVLLNIQNAFQSQFAMKVCHQFIANVNNKVREKDFKFIQKLYMIFILI